MDELFISWTERTDEGIVHRKVIFDSINDMLDCINQLKAQRNIKLTNYETTILPVRPEDLG